MYSQTAKQHDFRLPDHKGKVFVLSKQKSKLVILYFFNPLLSVCTNDIIHLIQMQNRYKNKDVSFVGMTDYSQSSELEIMKMSIRYKLNFPVLKTGNDVKEDLGGIYTIPAIVMLDRKGRILERFNGYINTEGLSARIERYLNGK
ncbi:MAG: TlpA disulfide reductase family protein [bacterium]|nr:TlpA disulfide reductase family protein [bacterium]